MAQEKNVFLDRSQKVNEAYEARGAELTLVDRLERWATERPEEIAYWFTESGVDRAVTYAEIDRRARAIAADLARRGVAPGSRVLLLYPPGLDYLAGLLGCFYLGGTAVPAYPPDPGRLDRTLPRLRAVVTDCQATAALTTSLVLEFAHALLSGDGQLGKLLWLATDQCSEDLAGTWQPPSRSPDSLALLQYTSGSTGAPKGVMLRHAHLVHNSRLIQGAFGLSARSVGVIWLPPYHDMGLIGGILQPLYTGFPTALMSPFEFLQRPLRWLEAISRLGGTCSGGPNFAFDLCVRKTTPEQRSALNLSSWDVAFCGAEPVRAGTLDRFAESFAPSGFRREAFYPCYGLAEATLIVSGGKKADPPVVRSFGGGALERGQATSAKPDEPRPRVLVGCGAALEDTRVAIIDPASGTRCAPGQVGEIWVQGQSVAGGYWNQPELTRKTFQARIEETGDGPFLRTGDLGFLHEGELFISARLKDLIILRGKNHYPQDIERMAEGSHPGVRPGCSAAFSVETDGEERLVIAQEIAQAFLGQEEEIAAAIRRAVAAEHDVEVHTVACIRAGSLPKTSSGKVQRWSCKQAFLDGALDATSVITLEVPPSPPPSLPALTAEALRAAPPEARQALVERYVAELAARKAGLSPARVDAARPLSALGLDSLSAVELTHMLERQLGVEIPAAEVMGAESIRALGARVARFYPDNAEEPAVSVAPPPVSGRSAEEGPPSRGEQALWVTQRLHPSSSAYNLVFAARVLTPLDVQALETAVQALAYRHPSLRASYTLEGEQPLRRVDPVRTIPFQVIESEGWDEPAVMRAIDEEAHTPFDLAGPLLRVSLYRRPEGEHVLIAVMHHICADFWSAAVLLEELGAAYAALCAGKAVALPPVERDYLDFSRRLETLLEGPEGERQWAYWARQLGGELPALDLPTDRPRSAEVAPRGATLRFSIPAPLVPRLRALAAERGVTLFAVLLSAFQVLLARYAGQDEILVGTPASARSQAGFERVVGYFVNPLVLRADLRDGPSFKELLARAGRTVREAFEHRDLPFSTLVERLRPTRAAEQTPIFQVMFVFNRLHLGGGPALAPLLGGAPGARAELGGLGLEGVALSPRAIAFELTLNVVDADAALIAAFQYDAALFDEATVGRMAGHLVHLLEAAADDPERSVRDLPMMRPAERAAILGTWSMTPAEPVQVRAAHELFEAQARRTPEAVAVLFEGAALTYAELDQRAERVARRLRALGVGPGVLVGLCIERSLEMAACVLGALKAGGAYVPLDPAYPPERLAFMLDDAGAPVLLTEERLRGIVPARDAAVISVEEAQGAEADAAPDPPDPPGPPPAGRPAGPDDIAYVIYTSGSTGKPKGVALPHRALIHLTAWQLHDSAAGPGGKTLQFAPLSFDVHAQEMLATWASGGCLVVVPEETRRDLPALARLLDVLGVERVFLPFAALQAFAEVAHDRAPRSLREVITAGEQLRITGEIRGLFERLQGCRLFNHYGPSETHVVTSHRLEGPARGWPALPPIGRPIAGAEVYVLDQHMEPVPPGVRGELYLGGAGLARGYVGRAALTAERFVPHPFSAAPGARLYRTGDLARHIPDGSIEFLGRVDHQVKIRGYRVEPEEVEAVLATHPAVALSAVVVRQTAPGQGRLAAYVTARDAEALTAAALSAFLRERLPAYMIPSTFTLLDAMPTTPSGKIDRRALPAVTTVDGSASGERVGPRTEAEALLCEVWQEVLGAPEIGVHDDFFALGGHSLLATRVVVRVRQRLGVELPLRALFQAPTVAALAERLQQMRREAAPPIEPAPRDQPLPLSFAQQRLWLLGQLDPDSPAYNIPAAVRIEGPLDADALERSLAALVARHEALRTTFPEQGGAPRQRIAEQMSVAVPVVDLSALSEGARAAEVQRLAAEEAKRPFDLAQGPLLRAALLRLGAREHVLLLTVHHIVADGWSLGVLVQELSSLYDAEARGAAPLLRPLPLTYADFSMWQRRWMDGPTLAAELAHWTRKLEGCPSALPLPTDRSRPARISFRGASHDFLLQPALTGSLKELCAREGVTLFMGLLSAFMTLLFRYSGQEDIVVGSPIAGRTRVELEGLIGVFVNTLALRGDLSEDPSFLELMRRVRELTLDAYAHQDVPFEKLVEALAPERHLDRSPLFQVMFVLQNAPMPALRLGDMSLSVLPTESVTSKFDLTLSLEEADGGLRGRLEYSTDLFEPATMARMAGHFRSLLEGVAEDAGRRLSALPLLGEAERRQLLGEWNDTKADYPSERCIHELFEAQAEKTPEATAVVFGDQRLTYLQLNQRANQLAHHLQSRGVGPEVLVGLCVERSVEMVVGMLGILKAGGAYVPLDPTYPGERLAFVIEDAGMQLLLTQRRLAEGLPKGGVRLLCLDADGEVIARAREEVPVTRALPTAPAYVIYTSGSTGKPKGVVVSHRNLVHSTTARRLHYREPVERFLVVSSFAFDSSIAGIFWTLCQGGTVVLPSDAFREDPAQLTALIAAQRVTHMLCVPSLYAFVLEQAKSGELLSLNVVMVAGEAAPVALVARHHALLPRAALFNEYGPTEATVWCSVHETTPAEREPRVPIGKPIANTRLYVLDGHLRPMPVGMAGELYIGGAGVARGYLNQPALTAERFLPDPFSEEPGARLYKSGDLCQWRSDGELEFLGRLDHQVKIRGYRIELGEIESVLGQHPAVREAVVVAREEASGDRRLVAYVAARHAPLPGVSEMRTYLRARLPEYMIPAAFVELSALPLLPNGKIDRRSLPTPDGQSPEQERSFAAPRTPTQEVLAGVWADVLHRERVGIFDDFFTLGGHSLLATQVVARLRPLFGVELPLRALFEAPTVAALGERIEAALGTGVPLSAPPLVALPRQGELPLSFAQQRLWLLDQLEPGSPLYNMPATVRLKGALDVMALERSLDELVRRHESLRTTFRVEAGGPVQVIADVSPFHIEPIEPGDVPPGTRGSEALRLLHEEARRPFNLSTGPLFRAVLVKLGEDEHLLLLAMHHIIADGWSMGVFIRELAALYEALSSGHPCHLAPLPLQYVDFARWQRSWLQGEVLEQQLAFWREQLDDAPPALDLPTDRPRPAVQTSHGAILPIDLSGGPSDHLRALCRREGVTPFMALLAAFQVVLARHSGQDDLCIGTPIAGRNRAETEGLIGFFVNTLVLRTKLSGDPSFRRLLERVRQVCLGAYAHQDVPFEKLVEELRPTRDPSRSPLFQVFFVLNNVPLPALSLPGLDVEALQVETQTAKFDLALALDETPAGFSGVFRYNTVLFDEATIARLGTHLRRVLEAAIERPEESISTLPMLTDEEKRQILTTWNDTDVTLAEELGIQSLFERQAARSPDAVAVCQEGRSLTYAALDRQATRLARHLRARGVKPEAPVALCLERSPGMLVGILAIFKAGGAYVPMDPSLPPQRIAFMLEDTGAEVLLTQRALHGELPSGRAQAIFLEEGEEGAWQLQDEEDAALPGPDAERCAYIIYTSGSTGVPKGVEVTHRAAVNHLCFRQAAFPLNPADTFLQKASCGFDISLWEMFAPLLAGGRLLLARPGGQKDSDYLSELVAREEVTVIHFGPAPLAAFLQARGIKQCRSLRYVFCGGEPLTPELRDRFFSLLSAELIHQYGPTETCIDATVWRCAREAGGGSIPIGRPIANTRAYVLDAHLQPVPIGVAGELYIGGVSLARGYLRRPALTAERFIPDPFSLTAGERLYRTGDRVCWLADGSLLFLGRVDDQIKLRGYRIELGEIASALRQHPGVREAVVTVHESSADDKRLVAYVVSQEGQELTTASLRGWLQDRLPEHMVPSFFVPLPALPLSRHGKVDRKALPPPEGVSQGRELLLPRDPFELVVVSVFEETLRPGHPIGVRDNFFELGGHSLLAVRAMAQMEERTGYSLPLDALLQAPTPEQLARLLRLEPGDWSPLVPIQPAGDKAPFFCVHPVGGNVLCYTELARCLGRDQPFYGLQAQGLDGQLEPLKSIQEMAALYVEAIRDVEPHGPYRLGGWSLGAVVAFEMARLLLQQGEAVDLLALIEPSPTSYAQGALEDDPAAVAALFAMDMARLLGVSLPAPEFLPVEDADALVAMLYDECNKAGALLPEGGQQQIRALLRVFSASFQALRRHTLEPLDGALHVLRGTDALPASSVETHRGWGALSALGVHVVDVPGDHYSILRAPHVEALARALAQLLARADEADDKETAR